MYEETTNLEALRTRLSTLERRENWSRRALFGLAGLLLCGLLIAAALPETPVIKTQKLLLVGPKGETRCVLEVDDAGSVVQTFSDTFGKQRIKLTVDSERIARFMIYDDEGHYRVGASSFPADFEPAPSQAGIAVFGHENDGTDSSHGGIFLSTRKNGSIDQVVYDANGISRVTIGTNPESKFTGMYVLGKSDEFKGSAELGVFDENGMAYQQLRGSDAKPRYLVSAGGDVEAAQYFFDANNAVRLNMGVTKLGVASQNFLDDNGKTRIQSAVVPGNTSNEGAAAIGFASTRYFDASGIHRLDLSTYGSGQVSNDFYDDAGNIRISNVILSDGNSLSKHFDASGKERIFAGTFANGESGQAILDRNGGAKMSSMVKSDDSLSHYVAKSSAEEAWETYQTTRDILQIGQDVLDVIEFFSEETDR